MAAEESRNARQKPKHPKQREPIPTSRELEHPLLVIEPPHQGALAQEELDDDAQEMMRLAELATYLFHPANGSGVFVPTAFRKITQCGDQALCLAQIFYWFRAGRDGKPRARIFKSGQRWLAKTHKELGAEVGLTQRQVKSSLDALRKQGLIDCEYFKFNGAKTTHVRLNLPALIHRLELQIIPVGKQGARKC